MTAIVFVHGTGVRKEQYHKNFSQIQDVLDSQRPDVHLIPCLWGPKYGASLRADGASIPSDNPSRSIQPVEELEIVLWSQLYLDPLYELHVLAIQPKTAPEASFRLGHLSPGDELDARVRAVKMSAPLHAMLNKAECADLFDQARQSVTESSSYRELIHLLAEPLQQYQLAIARAIVATLIMYCEHMGRESMLSTDASFRDALIALLTEGLGGNYSSRSLSTWTVKILFNMAVSLGAMNHIQRKRRAITDAVYPFVGDILIYQNAGDDIRSCIRDAVHQAAKDEPVVLLAHSLGGIACLDLLATELLPQVKLLITVGSQAPFLYEINALHSRKFDQLLPDYPAFPEWINIYDRRDLLSYIGSQVFRDRVKDIVVDNNQPFPRSHSAYWTNPQVWEQIVPRLP